MSQKAYAIAVRGAQSEKVHDRQHYLHAIAYAGRGTTRLAVAHFSRIAQVDLREQHVKVPLIGSKPNHRQLTVAGHYATTFMRNE
ncbi:MAG TPA: hypothetical protein VFK47_14940, partial [Ktedonobacteraceae bacterium]|nr:hypothetical protein [Ktedonobacteraceae bacterium]